MDIQNSMQTKDEKHFYYMGLALQEAEKAMGQDEVPVGAILVRDDEILAKGYNQTECKKSPFAHAEILVLEEASKKLKGWRLLGTTLYVTLEPCSMCAGALVLARVQSIVFSLKDSKSGACGSVFNIVQNAKINHRIEITEGIRSEESLALLQNFFRMKRQKNKIKKQVNDL